MRRLDIDPGSCRRPAPILKQPVRTVIALALALVIAVSFAADPVACVDGCTDESPAPHASARPICHLCQRGVALDAVAVRIAPTVSVRRVHHVARRLASPPLVRSIDHPPRRA